jgi:hypothetical protein
MYQNLCEFKSFKMKICFYCLYYNIRSLFQKLKFWESLYNLVFFTLHIVKKGLLFCIPFFLRGVQYGGLNDVRKQEESYSGR